ncbi:type 4a pilus biogenesis protein PilO [Legionella oakridgensis]|uniref:Tfp pilus assembly protein PilO n=2 Tax=Legionella oakridgensis TaxID=29423 RepID=W0BA24_9GAMM|nr:type 4a pilus biogenesis protein PilO [Legionella oakridgensis]AHE66710.1 Tfp pilus assembly protein PilO [Legionella oakridgensis ATCC 33761 = DSM 21215]ETO93580.1 Tfp pilus assembly protein PilO [Legionella oakridgensis RV-2-2007]KTD38086.1 type IV pilus biogenesis protein PilO [Legionella oakridgensis]STY19845.1 type IV pilus biogenesis protein PilO [Legionella longbeachae]
MNNFSLNELTLENVGQWPKSVKIGVIAFLSILVVGMGYWLIIKSNFEQYEQLKEKEVSLKQEFELKQHQASNLQAYRNQMQIMQERFGNMLKQLPTQNEMPGLLEDISKTGIASGLTFELFAPQPEVQHDFYIELPIKITVVGNYHQLAVFLSRVAAMSRIVTLHDFMIEGAATDKQKSGTGDQLIMKMTAKIYRYRTL